MRFEAKTRATALEAGWWQKADHSLIRLVEMPDPYLLNALLKALADREPTRITEPLAAEVLRRGIQNDALALANKRDAVHLPRVAKKRKTA